MSRSMIKPTLVRPANTQISLRIRSRIKDNESRRETTEPRREKTCLRGLRPGTIQTGLLSYRD